MESGSRVRPLALSYTDYVSRQESLVKLKLGDYVITEEIGKGNYGKVYKKLKISDC